MRMVVGLQSSRAFEIVDGSTFYGDKASFIIESTPLVSTFTFMVFGLSGREFFEVIHGPALILSGYLRGIFWLRVTTFLVIISDISMTNFSFKSSYL